MNAEELSNWFSKVIKETNFIQHGPVKGTMLMGPFATKIWNNIKREFETTVLRTLPHDADEVIFPTLLPKAMLEEEKNHIEGFAPELWITHRKTSAEDIVLRPTSEVIFNKYFANREFTYKELPVIWNQWANVFRIEENVKPFLRTSEFLWQEGHTFHETEREARELAILMMHKYAKFMNDVLLLPTYHGEKTLAEKFAGAKRTYGVESIMLDGQSVQIATSHDLSNNFTKAFQGNYKTGGNTVQLAYGSSWGFSTRAMGAMLLMHGDDNGFVVPTKIAAYQVLILAHDYAKWDKEKQDKLQHFKKQSKYSIKIEKPIKNAASIKWNHFNQGTPIVLNLGTRDFDKEKNQLTTKEGVEKNNLITNIFRATPETIDNELKVTLTEIDERISFNAKKRMFEMLTFSKTKEEVISSIKEGKHTLAFTSLTKDEEIQMKKNFGFSIRVLISDEDASKFSHLNIEQTKCVFTSKQGSKLALISRAY